MNRLQVKFLGYGALSCVLAHFVKPASLAQAATLVGSMAIQPHTHSLNQEELSDIRAIAAELEEEVAYFEQTYGSSDDTLINYELEYQKQLASWQPTQSTPLSIAKSISRSELLLVGDNHQLYENTENFIKLIRQNGKPDKTIILLESLSSHKQSTIDAWLSGELPDTKLRNALEFDRFWPFHWKNTQNILTFAKNNGIPVLAMEDRRNPGDLKERDAHIADFIKKTKRKYPDHVIAVQIGNLHLLGENHLYDRLRTEHRTTCVINTLDTTFDDVFYESGDLQKASHWKLDDGVYFNSTVTPMESTLQDFLYWSELIGLQEDAESLLDELNVDRFVKKLTRARKLIMNKAL